MLWGAPFGGYPGPKGAAKMTNYDRIIKSRGLYDSFKKSPGIKYPITIDPGHLYHITIAIKTAGYI